MASFRPHKRGTKKWIARRKREGLEYFLGYFHTQGEAMSAESDFDAIFPPFCNTHGRPLAQR